MKVFLGGTCNGSKWREELFIPNLKIDYFNPVVDHWDDNARITEAYEKEHDDFLLFVLTPLMKGFFSIAEVVDESNKRPKRTILCVLDSDDGKEWSDFDQRALTEVKKMVSDNGAFVFDSLEEVYSFLNEK